MSFKKLLLIVNFATVACMAIDCRGGYPTTGTKCLDLSTSTCDALGNDQCAEQDEEGSGCTRCDGSGSAPAKSCVVVENGPGCSPTGTHPLSCGARFFGECYGTMCSGGTEDGTCSAVAKCG